MPRVLDPFRFVLIGVAGWMNQHLGVHLRFAANTAGSGRGPWYLALSKALSVGLCNAYFRSLGLPPLFEDC